MSKKLTLADIKNQNKVFEQKQKIELSDEFHLFIYPHFSPTKIAELIKEIVTDPDRAKQACIKFDEIDMTDWVAFNIVYKFAELGIPSEIKKKVQAFTTLMDSDFFWKIIDSFPKESIDKLNKAMQRFEENLNLLRKENELITDEKIDELIEIE